MKHFRRKSITVPQCPNCGKMLGEWPTEHNYEWALMCIYCKHVAMIGVSHEMLRDWFKSMSKKRRTK